MALLPLKIHRLGGDPNYFIGNNPAHWRTNVPTYSQVRCNNLYPGVDVLYHSEGGQLRYDIIVAPGADPSWITLDFPDAYSVIVERGGGMRILMGAGAELSQSSPLIFQYGDYGPEAVRGRYVAVGPKQVRFEIGEYDHSRELVIDPIIFSTYLGGTGSDSIYSMAQDAAGNIYVGGSTNSANFPVVTPFDATVNGSDVFVTKINAAGTAILYSTYLGGTGGDGPVFGGLGIAVNGSGEVAITSETSSDDFPTVAPFQATRIFFNDAFVTKFNAAGNGLIFSTYLGSMGFDFGNAVAFDASGSVYVAGNTTDGLFAPLFPKTPGAFQSTYQGGGLKGDAFVTKFSPTGSMVYSTLLGGGGEEECYAITVLGGNAYVAGFTQSANFPTTPGAFRTASGGGQDMFVAQVNPTGTAMVYSTYLGGSGTDGRGTFPFGGPLGLIVDGAGNAYIGSASDSTNYPVTPGAFQTTKSGGVDAVVTKLNPAGSGLVFSTYLGGTGDDIFYAINLDAAGNIYVAGDTASANYPMVNPVQAYNGPFGNVAATVMNPTATSVLFSTALGSGLGNSARGVAPDAVGNVWLAGAGSNSFPQVNPLIPSPGAAGFVAKIAPSFAGVTVTPTGGSTDVTEGGATDTYSVVLGSPPSANVVITLNPGTQLSVVPATLTFTPANWNTPKVVTVTAVDDLVIEGPHSGTILHTATSTDAIYNNFVVASVVANITDNDFPITRTLYGVTWGAPPNQLIRIDPLTGAGTVIGPLSGTIIANGVAFRGGKMYLYDAGGSKLIHEINPGSGATIATIDIGLSGLSSFGEGDMAFRSDGMGFLSGSPFWRFDVTVPNNTQITPLLIPSPRGLAFNAADVLYGFNVSQLFTVNQTTGALTAVGPTGIVTSAGTGGLAFEPSGALFAALGGTPSTLYRVSPSTGAATLVGNIGINGVSGLAFANHGVIINPSANSTNVTEGGATDTYAVSLLTAPTANVTISMNAGAQLTATPASVTFTPANWNVPQNVTVTAIDDPVLEGNHSGTITHTSASGDPNYNAIFVYSLTASITDNDAPPPGVNITQSGGTTAVAEGGATDTYTVALNAAPTAIVTVTINPGTQLTVAPTTLTFTPANWSTPQTVTVTAVNDIVVEGVHTGTITHTAASTDAAYSGISIASVAATITDNDFPPGVTITQSGGSTRVIEGGATDSYTVVLNSVPTANVTINLNPGTQVTLAPATLTFTPANWNTPQTVTVTAVDDTAIEGNPHTGIITHTAVSTDAAYAGIAIVGVAVTIAENDFPPPDAGDTSEKASDMGVLGGTKIIKGVDTYRHPGGKFDDDWYAWTMSKNGTFTVDLKNVLVSASGPKGQYSFGDLHFRMYRVFNGNLTEFGASQTSGSKTISIPVQQGERILVWVYGLYFTQAQYDITADLK